jgi:hypothetical protein
VGYPVGRLLVLSTYYWTLLKRLATKKRSSLFATGKSVQPNLIFASKAGSIRREYPVG